MLMPKRYRPVVLGLAAVGVVAVNWLRVRARDHWTTDVLAGDLLGIGAVGASQIMKVGAAEEPRRLRGRET
jgi:membrane-associated phospholipid phosphatase